MTAKDFCYWLQGYFELNHAGADHAHPLSQTQVECVQRHLSLVFVHDIDPKAGGPETQAALNKIHSKCPAPDKDVVYRC